ncbi:hypothetical protein MMC25_001854 [Agyrium rufum]|nr:hypothetical protein [Agyrium rufum]
MSNQTTNSSPQTEAQGGRSAPASISESAISHRFSDLTCKGKAAENLTIIEIADSETEQDSNSDKEGTMVPPTQPVSPKIGRHSGAQSSKSVRLPIVTPSLDEVLLRYACRELAERQREAKIVIPCHRVAIPPQQARSADIEYHKKFLCDPGATSGVASHSNGEEVRVSPLFSGDVLNLHTDNDGQSSILPQYGLLGERASTVSNQPDGSGTASVTQTTSPLIQSHKQPSGAEHDNRIFLNINAPWSAFICGSQGSGKSHTMSCMLENALLPSGLGRLPEPLAGIVFHYDRFGSYTSTQVCEAAYLASSGIPVKVLVSPSNYWKMNDFYTNLPGLPKHIKKPEVIPLLFRDEQLDSERLMTLMAVKTKEGSIPLYMEAILRILRQMAIEGRGSKGLNYQKFKLCLEAESFNRDQNGPLKMRLALLESFMTTLQTKVPVDKISSAWKFEPGSLTIVDLSCPFVDDGIACSLFSICLALFLENREKVGRIVALDEAHKFMSSSDAASAFTENLLQVIRQQRHLATRVIIATQEPTISPKLLSLCSMTVVHRFTSPDWMSSLKHHLAGISSPFDNEGRKSNHRDAAEIFHTIVNLDTGHALLFAPSAMLDVVEEEPDKTPAIGNELGKGGTANLRAQKLGMGYVKLRIRKRITVDGGRSIMSVLSTI